MVSYAETLLGAILERVLADRSFTIRIESPTVLCRVNASHVDKQSLLESCTGASARLMAEILAGELPQVPLVRLLCVLVRGLTVEKRRKPQREIMQGILGSISLQLGVLVDLHLEEVSTSDLDMIPVASGTGARRGRKVSRTVRLARARVAVRTADKRAFAAGAHWQQRKRQRVLEGGTEHVQTDREGIRDQELRVHAYWSRLRSRSSHLRSVSVCTDGTRSASGREVLTFALAASGSREAMWLPVQVTERRSPQQSLTLLNFGSLGGPLVVQLSSHRKFLNMKTD
eukprot:6490596-Amphidinium_carterae.1